MTGSRSKQGLAVHLIIAYAGTEVGMEGQASCCFFVVFFSFLWSRHPFLK